MRLDDVLRGAVLCVMVTAVLTLKRVPGLTTGEFTENRYSAGKFEPQIVCVHIYDYEAPGAREREQESVDAVDTDDRIGQRRSEESTE